MAIPHHPSRHGMEPGSESHLAERLAHALETLDREGQRACPPGFSARLMERLPARLARPPASLSFLFSPRAVIPRTGLALGLFAAGLAIGLVLPLPSATSQTAPLSAQDLLGYSEGGYL